MKTGIRGFIDAYDAKTGKRAWRFYTIPGPGEPGQRHLEKRGKLDGGATWVTGAYDPELNLVYWGIGNPGPDWNGDPRPGDNLYTYSLVALDGDTGKLRWHFQFTPHDMHDWDATQMPVLFDDRSARQRKLIATPIATPSTTFSTAAPASTCSARRSSASRGPTAWMPRGGHG